MVDCAEKLRYLRETRHLSQHQVAKNVGVSKASISAYENGSKVPSIEVMVRLARYYHVTMDYLVSVGDESKLVDLSGVSDETVALIVSLVDRMRNKDE